MDLVHNHHFRENVIEKKRLLLTIAFGLSSRKVRVGQGKNEGNLVTHSLSAKEYVTCDMCHENAKNISQHVFIYQKATNYQNRNHFRPSWFHGEGKGGGTGGTGSIGGAWGQS